MVFLGLIIVGAGFGVALGVISVVAPERVGVSPVVILYPALGGYRAIGNAAAKAAWTQAPAPESSAGAPDAGKTGSEKAAPKRPLLK